VSLLHDQVRKISRAHTVPEAIAVKPEEWLQLRTELLAHLEQQYPVGDPRRLLCTQDMDRANFLLCGIPIVMLQ